MQDTKLREKLSTLLAADMPGLEWRHGDDLCDCTFQRIGEWTNPYIGKTLRVRFCCIWAEFHKLFPDFVQEIPMAYDHNSGTFVDGAAEWDSADSDMPRAIWYRQIATRTGRSLDDIREEYRDQDPPPRVVYPSAFSVLGGEDAVAVAGTKETEWPL